MTSTQWAALERQARRYVQKMLDGPDSDAAIRAIVAWEWMNPSASPDRRAAAWARITEQATFAY
jgi:hypothetical protein